MATRCTANYISPLPKGPAAVFIIGNYAGIRINTQEQIWNLNLWIVRWKRL